MSPTRRLSLAVVALAAFTLWPAHAEAACTLSTTSVAFGAYDVFNASPVDSTGTVTLRCAMMDDNIDIKLSKGGATTYTPRRLIFGSDLLTYNLYLDAARTSIWGDGTGGTSFYFNANPPDNTNFVVTIYGRIPATQDVRAGSYTDTVVATITW